MVTSYNRAEPLFLFFFIQAPDRADLASLTLQVRVSPCEEFNLASFWGLSPLGGDA